MTITVNDIMATLEGHDPRLDVVSADTRLNRHLMRDRRRVGPHTPRLHAGVAYEGTLPKWDTYNHAFMTLS